MSVLGDRMALILTLLAAAYPSRVVTRDLLPFDQRKRSELEKGIWSLVSGGEKGYANYNGREGEDGRQSLTLVGQFVVAEDDLPSKIEEAEFTMVEELKSFMRSRDPRLAQLFMLGFRQSQQMDHPFGWVSVDLEFLQ